VFGFGKKVDAAEVTAEVLAHKALLIDVREDEEWDNGHAKNALHLSVDRIMRGELPTKDPAKKLYLYCASGARASMATSYLRRQGLTVENIGGLRDWTSGGGSTE